MRKIPGFFEYRFWRFKRFFAKMYIAECGHVSKIHDEVRAFGRLIKTRVPLKDGKIEYCHACLAKMAIQCAWCKSPIFIGDMITLYSPVSKDFKIPGHAKVYSENPLQLVGCQCSDCTESGADYCGVWVPPGKVERFPSALEIAAITGQPVIVIHYH
ncbi:MAG: hypothetical protein MUD00_01725 [Candidatus Pacebacteria bacterium]|jgi:hypothetical protein|nr:hypothetical protein [Candidatus Paceibacterota bacterium]